MQRIGMVEMVKCPQLWDLVKDPWVPLDKCRGCEHHFKQTEEGVECNFPQ